MLEAIAVLIVGLTIMSFWTVTVLHRISRRLEAQGELLEALIIAVGAVPAATKLENFLKKDLDVPGVRG